jgi:hypothetical protein
MLSGATYERTNALKTLLALVLGFSVAAYFFHQPTRRAVDSVIGAAKTEAGRVHVEVR